MILLWIFTRNQGRKTRNLHTLFANKVYCSFWEKHKQNKNSYCWIWQRYGVFLVWNHVNKGCEVARIFLDCTWIDWWGESGEAAALGSPRAAPTKRRRQNTRCRSSTLSPPLSLPPRTRPPPPPSRDLIAKKPV